MSANELIEKWPDVAGADAAAIFGMDAWAMPEPPAATTLVLLRKGHMIAEGRLQALGAQSAFAVEGLKG